MSDTVIVCGTRRKHKLKCKYCSRPATAVCDFSTSCQAPICGQCTQLGNCRIHRLRGDNPSGNTTTTTTNTVTETTNENAAG